MVSLFISRTPTFLNFYFDFADYTCLLNIEDSIKKINKVVNKDLKFLIHWLHTNNIYLNVAKTEKKKEKERKKKQFDFDLNLTICGKRLQTSSYVKYQGLYLYQYFDWSPHINHLSHKLVKANAMFSTLCQYCIWSYYTINLLCIYSHLSYVCTAWGHNLNPKHSTNLPQKKACKYLVLLIMIPTHYQFLQIYI